MFNVECFSIPMIQNPQGRSVGWMGLQRGHRAKPLEWLAEKFIFLVSLSAILMIFLIFIFIGREALPVALGQMNSSLTQTFIPVEDMDKVSPKALQAYLGLTDKEFSAMDRETRLALMEAKVDEVKSASKDKDAAINTTRWKYLLLPYQWTGYDK